MSWLFSRALVEAYSGESCSDGEPFVQSNGNPTQQAYLSQDRMTAFSRLSRFGMKFAPLTESRGQELLTLYLAGFPAKTLVRQGGAGITGSRSGLWKEMARIIGEVRPRYAFVENSPMLATRGLGTVLGDLAAMGFDAEWCCLSAADCGAWHERNRIWILATNTKYIGARWREQQPEGEQEKTNATDHKKTGYATCDFQAHKTDNRPLGIKSWGGFSGVNGIEKVVTRFCRMDDGMANRVHRISSLGNGQVPRVAATAFRLLSKGL